MGMVVRTNAMAINANRQLGINNTSLGKSLEKLSSGYRINRAGDDASGLAISEKMKAQIKGLDQASSNAQDGISLVQTAEGATTEIHNMLNRMVELATKSANGTIQNAVDRDAIQSEVDALNSEITRITKSTNFNGIKLLDGSLGTGTSGAAAAIGANATAGTGAFNLTVSGKSGITVKFAGVVDGTNEKKATAAWSGSTLTISLGAKAAGATFTQEDIDKAISEASGAPANASGLKVTVSDITTTAVTAVGDIGNVTTAEAKKATATYTNTGNTAMTVTSNKAGNNTSVLTFAAASATNGAGTAQVADGGATTVYVDTSKEYTASELNSILDKAGAGMSVSFNGSTKVAAGSAAALANGAGLASGGGLTLQIGDTADDYNKVTVSVDDLSAAGLGTEGLNVSDQDSAGNAIQTIKDAINQVSTNRANLGALQNRMEYTINNLNTTAENMTTANSRIRDTDMASEMTKYTQSNILTQAAQAMLAQANQAPQQILQLLQ
jgi:flagellin